MSTDLRGLKWALDGFVFQHEGTRYDGSKFKTEESGLAVWPRNGVHDVEVDGVGTVRVVDVLEGGDGYGENIHIVFQITSGGVTKFYKIDGYYTSYDGSDYNGWPYEVKPVQTVVTTFEGV